MEVDKQIRFLYPPFILFGSLFLGLYFNNINILTVFNFIDNENLIGALFGGGVIILLAGYIIGTITISFLRIFFFIISLGKETYETSGIKNYENIGKLILKEKKIIKENKLYALATYDHEFLPENIHKWIQKRWTAFHTSANSVTSLILSLSIGLCLGINVITWWSIVMFLFIIMFFYHSNEARKETIGMIDFQTGVERKDSMTSASNP
jgi:hypothetical protein